VSYLRTQECECDDLRTLFLFEALSDDQLDWLCRRARIDVYGPGPVITEGEPTEALMVLMDGEIVVSKRSGTRDIETNRTSHRGSFFGAVAPFLDNPPAKSLLSVRALTQCEIAVIDADAFGQFVRERFPMAVHLLQGMWGDNEHIHSTVDYQNRIRSAGTIAAGLAHGLNNPASATVRAASDLRAQVDRLSRLPQPDNRVRNALAPLLTKIECQMEEKCPVLIAGYVPALERAGREDEVTDWLDEHGIAEPWDMAVTLVAAHADVPLLDEVVDILGAIESSDPLDCVLNWMATVLGAKLALADIEEAGGRISELVDASADYSHLDGSLFDVVDLHKILDATIDVLAVGDDITVVRQYDPNLPGVPCYPGEVSQAFTHLVHNAIDAMRDAPADRVLTLRTDLADDAVLVEIGDTGHGVDPSIRDHIFDPFFTTKAVGEGAGLGLNVAWRVITNRHGGTLSMQSVPGDTRFTVLLHAHAEART
jgi:signal transduction histidine kinase